MRDYQNLAEGLLGEIKRNMKLLDQYKEIGPVGSFGHSMILKDVEDANIAMMEGDIIKMIQIHEVLKKNN